MKVVVVQKGAREHFLAARALHRSRMLAKLVVDWYAPSHPLLRRVVSWVSGSRGAAALAARSDEIPDRLVRSNWLNGLRGKWEQTIKPCHGSAYQRALQVDVAFTKAVARLKLPPHEVFFGYSYMSLEMLEVERARGAFTVVDQIDPGPVEFRLVAEEMARYPELAGLAPEFPTEYYDRLRREWNLADVLIVNSVWSRDAIVGEGADPAKIEILPLAFEATVKEQKSETRSLTSDFRPPTSVSGPSTLNLQPSTAPLRVLWLGQVNVRKGIHYLMQAARLLEHEKIQFDVVGPIGILPAAVAAAPRNMTFHGPVSRDRAVEWYRQSDVFVLPTLSDGFALTQLEALAHGLPVIATPNCGRVVIEGETGFLVPDRDAVALANAIRKFTADRSLSAALAPACRAAVQAYSIDAYGRRLVAIIQRYSDSKARLPSDRLPSSI